MAPPMSDIGIVKRLRLLAGLWACLAVLAASLSVAGVVPATAQAAASSPCDGCPDCKGMPCAPMPPGCALACVALPAVPAAAVVLPQLAATAEPWAAASAVLHGLARPPDPFPPRA
jgi:hypothetical protein